MGCKPAPPGGCGLGLRPKASNSAAMKSIGTSVLFHILSLNLSAEEKKINLRKKDPQQLDNVADDPQFAEIKMRFDFEIEFTVRFVPLCRRLPLAFVGGSCKGL
jgi:hypothetical protein